MLNAASAQRSLVRQIVWFISLPVLIFCSLTLHTGCSTRRLGKSFPAEMADQGIKARIEIPPDLKVNPLKSVVAAADPPGNPEVAADAPATPVPYRFDLPAAIAFARENSPRLRSARAAIERARGQEQVAFAPFLPQIGILSQSGETSFNQGPGAPGPTGFILASGDVLHQYTQVEAQLQWTIYDFGRTRSHYRQAQARERLTELQLNRAVQTVDFDVTNAYVNVLVARATSRVQEEAVQRAEAILHDSRARRKGGVADRDDLLRSEVQLSESKEALVNAREAEFATLARLNYVMGRNAGLPLQIVEFEAQPAAHPDLTALLEQAAAERPEVGIARQSVAAAQAGEEMRQAEFLPHIFARASTGSVNGSGVRTGWQEGAGLHLNVPLYTGGRNRGELRSASADVAAAVADAQSILDSISLEVNLAYRSLTASAERITLTKPAVVQAQENLRLVRVEYRNGTATPTDIVDAETSLTRAQQRYVSAIYSYAAALARLAYSLGHAQADFLQKPIELEELPVPRALPRAELPRSAEPILPVNAHAEATWQRAREAP